MRGSASSFALVSFVTWIYMDPVISLIVRRNADPMDRPSCPDTEATRPNTRVDTGARLAALRQQMTVADVQAYIVPSEDAHGSEYPPDYDKRRQYISGLSGSAGTAVVTETKAALWTDGRYFLQAEDELDCNWILMKQGMAGTPSITEWLKEELKTQPTNSKQVGAHGPFMMSETWTSYDDTLSKEDIIMTNTPDLVGNIWSDRTLPNSPINAYLTKYSGMSWQDKVVAIRQEMITEGASAVVVTDLSEVAWLTCARATDINYNPFFIGFAVVEHNKVSLYIHEKNTKLDANPTDPESKIKLTAHWNTGADGQCASIDPCIEVKDYNDIYTDVTTLANAAMTTKIWISYIANYQIYASIPEEKRIQKNTPIAMMKTTKNPVEVQGMKDAHARDSAAIAIYVSNLEKEVRAGKYWDELTGAARLKEERGKQPMNRGISFQSISAVGSNGAVIHYSPRNETNKQITTEEMYLLDSGGHYLDGSTDITRTFHFGTPTDRQKEMYTRVLMGSIDLATLKWPQGLYGRQIDAVARKPLWDVGLEYFHGTGHGMGHYLSIHEGPGRISLTSRPRDYDVPLDENMFFSDEPGFYQNGEYGIRLETIVRIVNASTTYQPLGKHFLTFEPIALVPFEPNLIDYSLLNPTQRQWLNDYHDLCQRTVGDILREQEQYVALDWLTSRTEAIPLTGEISSASFLEVSMATTVFVALIFWIF